VLNFMVSDADNQASIYNCLRLARENAHAVRGTITTEMWETLNATWLEAREKSFEQIMNAGVGEFFEWVKMRSSLSRGTTLGTLLQDEAYHFIRLGTLLERADNTARILDVKYHVLRRMVMRARLIFTSGARCSVPCRPSRFTARSIVTSSRRSGCRAAHSA
jgi:uncharacterized alpha-E superfamily protein